MSKTKKIVKTREPAIKSEISFTLIERVPSKAGRISLVKSPDPTNCSFQVGSLTVGAHGNMRARRTVTKPPEGKSACYGGLWPVPKALTGNGEKQIAGHLRQDKQMTRSQSGGQGKDAGRRITNVRRRRKSEPARITDRDGDCGRLSPVRWEKSANIREENGRMHLMFPVGVKGGGMC